MSGMFQSKRYKEYNMGCFNMTCAISGLPVTNYDDAVGLFFMQKDIGDGLKGCPDLHQYGAPYPIPFFGTYNDYGALEECNDDFTMEFLLGQVSTLINEREQGPNRFHDKPVSADNLTIEKLQDWQHSSRLQFKTGVNFVVDDNGIPVRKETLANIKTLFIRRGVYDAIVKSFQYEMYVGGEIGYKLIDVESIMDGLPEFLDHLNAYREVKGTLAELLETEALMELRSSKNILTSIVFDRHEGLWQPTLFRMPALRNIIADLDNDEQIETILRHCVNMYMINAYLERNHQAWALPGYGTQETFEDAYALKAAILAEEIDVIKHRWDEFE